MAMDAQSMKVVNAIIPGAIKDNASFTATAIDCLGFNAAFVFFGLGATDIAMAALKLQESDDDSTYADVTGTVFGTATDVDGTTTALPSATDDNKIEGWYLDLTKRKRYLKIVATAGDGTAGTYGAGYALLYRAEQAPKSSATLGCEHACVL